MPSRRVFFLTYFLTHFLTYFVTHFYDDCFMPCAVTSSAFFLRERGRRTSMLLHAMCVVHSRYVWFLTFPVALRVVSHVSCRVTCGSFFTFPVVTRGVSRFLVGIVGCGRRY